MTASVTPASIPFAKKERPCDDALARREPARALALPGRARSREPGPGRGRGRPPPPLPLPFPPNADARLPSEEPPRRPRQSRPLDPAVLRALAAEDPPIDALRAAATALVLAEPGRARSLVERARFAGWLPEVRIMVDRRFARTESVDLGTSTDVAALAPVGIDSNNDVRYQARATWDLSKTHLQLRRDRGAVPGAAHRRHASGDRIAGHPPLLRAPAPQGRVSHSR